ncbi:hypothetical protein EV384_5908 [Micromonospora kangleipakensis]|uniref:Uncharacterized protein n=1 Tax=Micromonospora kangleipakensis TaxID=1077942 RepID=A0A4Q8BIH7_9ACTN|nr:hypothetical protein [Micromonospora kangleipakensis]RZU77193.1 hypothetical protein EV384_5908 [Micromonospora kangleipakensis]
MPAESPRPRRGLSTARVLTWVALLCAVAVLLAAARAGQREPVGDRTVGEVTRVGVAAGDPVPAYLRAAADELARLTDPTGPAPGTYALVSFSAYLTPQRVAATLGPTPVSAVVARVPLPGRQTEIVRIAALRVPQDVVAGMAEVAARKDGEAADYRARAAAPAASADAELHRLYDTGARVAAEEAAAYRSACACVYAAVIRATSVALRGLAVRPGVRAVDPAPEVSRLDRTVFTPPLPEQRDVARPPADAALAPATPAGKAPAVGDSSEAARTVSASSPGSGGSAPGGTPPSTAPTSPDAAGGG